MLLILTILACAPTCDEVEGAICADDVAALQERIDQLEAAGTAYAWFDQDGVQVTTGPELVWFDDAGVLWQVDVDAGEPTAPPNSADFPDNEFHLTEDCSDEGFWANPPPAMTAFYMGHTVHDSLPVYVRDADSIVVIATAIAYTDQGSDCRQWSNPAEQYLVPTANIREISRPDVVWVAPLYPAAL